MTSLADRGLVVRVHGGITLPSRGGPEQPPPAARALAATSEERPVHRTQLWPTIVVRDSCGARQPAPELR